MVESLFVTEAKDDLKFIAARRWRQHAGAKIARKVRGQLFAFLQPGEQIVIATVAHATGHH